MITLDQVLALTDLALRVEVLPDPAAQVRWVAASDLLDPTPYLEGGELLLTTGAPLVRPDGRPLPRAGLSAYFARLAAVGVVGLGVGVGTVPQLPVVPEAWVGPAHRHGIALVTVPLATTFVQISRAVADLLAAQERSWTQRTATAQRDLIRAASGLQAPEQVLRSLATHLGARASVLDAAGGELAGSFVAGAPEHRGVQEVLVRMAADRTTSARWGDADAATSVHALSLTSEAGGGRYLVVTASRPHPATQHLVATAVALLSLDVERRRTALRTRRRTEDAVVGLLERGEHRAAGALLAAVDLPSLPEQVCVLAVGAGGGTSRGVAESVLRALEEAVAPGTALRADRGAHVLLVLDAAEAAVAQVRDAVVAAGGRVGRSRACAPAAVTEAAQAARRAYELTAPDRPVVHWDDVGGQDLGELLSPATMSVFARRALGPLLEQPDPRPALRSLAVFLRWHGQWQPAADELGVHRNTLRYRIGVVEKALEVDLGDAGVRASLWFALQHVLERAPDGAGPGQ